MPMYSFVDRQGNAAELFYSMENAPEIGAAVWVDGIQLTRVCERAPNATVMEHRHVAHSLPRVNPKDPYWPHYDDRGRPTFTGKQQVKELEARIAHLGGNFRWD